MKSVDLIYKHPVISVVMATYNGERYIAEAIESVLKQSYTHFEFIIVDDGSTDATADIVASYSDARIVYLKKDINSGIADSLNLGISKARGVYIARMDDDDVCTPNRFEEQLKIFEYNPELIVCGTSTLLDHDKKKYYPETHDDIKMNLLFTNPITHPTVMIKKAVFTDFKYNPDFVPSEDYDLWTRLIFEGQFYIIQSPLLYYRYRKDSETSSRRKEQLQLNAKLSLAFFKRLELDVLNGSYEFIRIFASRDYSISGSTLREFIIWFDNLKQLNFERHLFSAQRFNVIVEQHLETFLIQYFTNRTLYKKLVPFLYLSFKYKRFIMNYYLNKLF